MLLAHNQLLMIIRLLTTAYNPCKAQSERLNGPKLAAQYPGHLGSSSLPKHGYPWASPVQLTPWPHERNSLGLQISNLFFRLSTLTYLVSGAVAIHLPAQPYNQDPSPVTTMRSRYVSRHSYMVEPSPATTTRASSISRQSNSTKHISHWVQPHSSSWVNLSQHGQTYLMQEDLSQSMLSCQIAR